MSSSGTRVGTSGNPGVGVAGGLNFQRTGGSQSTDSLGYRSSTDSDQSPSEGEDDGHSLTKQLAETAVGVRELAKQLGMCHLYFLDYFLGLIERVLCCDLFLGRARVKTNIQSILIVTKARDNRLIQLTRELAIYLMRKKAGDSQRGLTVYVAPPSDVS